MAHDVFISYVRSHWQEHAQMANLELERQPILGGLAEPEVNLKCHFHAPPAGKGLWFEPRAKHGTSVTEYSADSGSAKPIPAQFLDLTDAIALLRQRGVTANKVTTASLQYDCWYDYRDIRGNNAILPPCPYKESGFHWKLGLSKGKPSTSWRKSIDRKTVRNQCRGEVSKERKDDLRLSASQEVAE
jgi:hypothetical protein